ncbi:MAG: hypothetical protein DMG70_22295 [Acidobacteria bacterium]|nr:MAG: hypothetical protein DMG70_22295 [Acidobacteriota bacterium]
MVEASMISTRIITSAFPARTEFSETTTSAERPAAVKGAPLFGAAKRTLDGEDRSARILREGMATDVPGFRKFEPPAVCSLSRGTCHPQWSEVAPHGADAAQNRQVESLWAPLRRGAFL